MTDIERGKALPLDKVDAHDRNFRVHPDEQIQALRASLTRFGQIRSIVVQEKGSCFLIVAGHGVTKAARTLGWKEINADVLPADMSASDVDAYLVADNRTAKDGQDDESMLLELLEEQAELGHDLLSVGSSEDELLLLIAGEKDEQVFTGSGITPSGPPSPMGQPFQPAPPLGVPTGVLANPTTYFPPAPAQTFDQPEEEVPQQVQPHPDQGKLLSLLNVTNADPTHQVERGDIWQLGKHVLLCVSVFNNWPAWTPYLKDDAMFLPYPGPLVVMTDKSQRFPLVLVQPDTYICGHILDRYSEIHGEGSVKRIATKEDVHVA